MILQNTVFVILTLAAIICTALTVKGQRMIMDTHLKVIDLITNFRKELHKTVKDALLQHVREYHK